MDQYLHHKALVWEAHASPDPDVGAVQVAAGAAQEGQQSEAAGELKLMLSIAGITSTPGSKHYHVLSSFKLSEPRVSSALSNADKVS